MDFDNLHDTFGAKTKEDRITSGCTGSRTSPIKWTLSTNDKGGVYDGERENKKGESVQ